MQGGGRDPFFGFGDPFGHFGGGGGQRSLFSSFFGGRDPFADPFFTRPFGSMFESNLFGSAGSPFMNPHMSGFREQQPPQPNPLRGPIIEELNSDDEKDERVSGNVRKENPKKQRRSSKEPFVEEPDDKAVEKRSKHIVPRNDINQMQHAMPHPRTQSFTFQSSSVSYGGANGTYYTSSRTRRAGSHGLTFEECKEADSSTGQATHRVSRGIHDKGHSVTRKLKSDGHVNTMQTLHNLDQDELVGFEQAWKGNARKHLPGWSEEHASQNVMGAGSSSQARANRGGWALPCSERTNNPGPRNSGRTRSDVRDGSGLSRIRSNGEGAGAGAGAGSSNLGKKH